VAEASGGKPGRESEQNVKLLTTAEFAAAMKPPVKSKRVHHLIAAGRIVAQRFGRAVLIDERELKKVANRKAGRPRKKKPQSRKAKP
jgi:hypothetical protein